MERNISAEIEKLTVPEKRVQTQDSTRIILLSRNGSGSNAGTAARDTGSISAARPMPRCPMTPAAWWTSTPLGLLLWFEGVPGGGRSGPDDIPDDFHPWYRDLIRWVNGTVHLLEKTAFYDGFYKAFGFGGYPCI